MKNIAKKKQDKSEYLKINKDKIKEQKRIYYQTNKEKFKAYQINYAKENKDIILQKQKEKLLTDPLYKLKVNTRNLINLSIKKSGFSKLSRTEEILGCSFDEFKQYIESLWEPWMNWENRGLYNGELNHGWDIDHIKPLTIANDYIDVIALNHYTNLRPLCSYTNRVIKRDNQ
jgi:hypothetical protein